MLKTVNIKNFKSVWDLKLDLGRVNVFIGENGCGKTSILEAISVASAALSNKLDQEFLSSRGVRITEPRLMKSAFNISEKDDNIDIDISNTESDFVNYKINYKNKSLVIEDFNTNIKPQFSIKEILEVFNKILSYEKLSAENNTESEKITENKNSKAIPSWLQQFAENSSNDEEKNITTDFVDKSSPQLAKKLNISNFLIYTPENYFLRRFEEEVQIKPIGVRGEGLFSHLVELFKENPEFYKELSENLKLINWFDGMEIPPDLSFTEMRLNIRDRFLKESIEYFDQRSANEGFLYLLFYFTLFLSNETPECFAIDNVDNALNPKLCKELIERIVVLSKEKQKQIILTTHNPSILDGLNLKDDDQRLFVIYRNADGHTKARRIKAPKEINDINIARLSEAFIRGYIGGLPKNF
ncbi:AAA family ATPase [uncultured Chryseobacterium sp.]|uniref:AAA family ATPase n=1 Tax=uncultured Chryseobacterium sp. TaxID=259322 RepID=UPI0025DC8E1B|nr:AAA family ATPase [uncultured Chryseobacterium sp.]